MYFKKINSISAEPLNVSNPQLDAESIWRRSTNCAEEEIKIAAGEFLHDALVTDTGDDGRYPVNACQKWSIMAEDNQVYVLITFDILITYTLLFSVTNSDIVCFVALRVET